MRANATAGCVLIELLFAGVVHAQAAPPRPAEPPTGSFAPAPGTAPAPAPGAPAPMPPPAPAPPPPALVPPGLPPGPPPAVTPPPGGAAPAEAAPTAPLEPPPPGLPPPAGAPQVYEPPPPPVPAPDPSIRRHDGFYLRLGLGVGLVRSRVEADPGDLSARGGGVAFDLALGGTVADGLVIGGGLYLVGMNTVTWSGDEIAGDVEGGSGSMGLLGVMVDYYPDARGGFHVIGALGIGSLAYERDNDTELPPTDWTGGGGGALLGVGYEAWVGDQWSLGGVARVLLVSGTLEDDSNNDIDATGFAPAILFVATHH